MTTNLTAKDRATLDELLTDREKAVLARYLDREKPAMIAHHIGCAANTVGVHLTNIRKKLRFLGLAFGRTIVRPVNP